MLMLNCDGEKREVVIASSPVGFVTSRDERIRGDADDDVDDAGFNSCPE